MLSKEEKYTEEDCYLLKFTRNGSILLFSKLFGGNSADSPSAFIADSDFIYLAGNTNSANFPIINNTNYDFYSGNYDGFICKFSIFDEKFEVSGLIGGAEDDWIKDIFLDYENNLFLTGITASNDFPVYNSFHTTFQGKSDCFVMKIKDSIDSIEYSSLIGGNNSDGGEAICIKSNGNALIIGYKFLEIFQSLKIVSILLLILEVMIALLPN